MTAAQEHVPVLAERCLALLDPRPGQFFIDCTVNGAGHSRAILERTGPDGGLLALDADPAAVELARERLAPFGGRARVVHANFRHLADVSANAGVRAADGVLMDLGVSSVQLEAAERGFSFSRDGPLDMRFDPTTGTPAAELLARWSARRLEQTLRELGEEPRARQIAQAIVAARRVAPLRTTRQLADLVARLVGRRGRTHPATRTFQALRMAVNDELGALAEALPQAVALLRRGARLAVISFHSLEDRLVKTTFARLAGRVERPRLPIADSPPAPQIRLVTRRPITPSEEEVRANPRSRSAKLRVAERI